MVDSLEIGPDAVAIANQSINGLRLTRLALYGHLVVLVLTAIAMTQDGRSLLWSDRWQPALEAGLMIGTLALLICPALLVAGLWRSSLTRVRCFLMLSVEGGIIFAHFIALLPGIQ